MTMRELAALANVSVSTVSKAFHDAEDVSKETKELIFETAKRYGCFGKYYKGRFSKRVFAIVMPELAGPYYNDIVIRLQELIRANNGIALVSTDNFEQENQEELVEYYASYLNVDGMFVFGLKSPVKKGYNIPIISLLTPTDCSTDSIQVDRDTPIMEAVKHLIELGHQRIAFAGEPYTMSSAQKVLNTAEKAAVSCCSVIGEGRYEQSGEDCARQILEMEKSPTAIICGYDNIAYGLIRYLTRHGYSIPTDFSVIGMNNQRTSQYMEHALTTIDYRTEEICNIAWKVMHKKLANCYYRLDERVVLSGRLIVRETTAPPHMKW